MSTKMSWISIALCIALASVLLAPAAAATGSSTGSYGGVQGDVSHPPSGTMVSQPLSTYYQLPVAVGSSGIAYWNVGGYWFTARELLSLPHECIKNDVSPYSNGDNGDSGDDGGINHVPVPVSWGTIAGFVGCAFIVNRKTVKV